MKKFWNWIHDDSGGWVLRLEGPIDEESFWGDEITPADFRAELEAEEGDVTVWINSPGGNVFAAAEISTLTRKGTSLFAAGAYTAFPFQSKTVYPWCSSAAALALSSTL